MVAPQFRHEYLRLPPLAVFSMRSPHSGHAFWSCFMFLESMIVIAMFQQLLWRWRLGWQNVNVVVELILQVRVLHWFAVLPEASRAVVLSRHSRSART